MVCDYFSTHSSGGSERVAREVAIRLAHRTDVIVEVFTAVPRGWPADKAAPELTVHTRPAFDLSPLLGVQLAVPLGSRAALRALLQRFRPHVMHAQSLHFASTVTAATLGQSTGIPLVTT